MLNVGFSSRTILASQYNAESGPTHDTSDRQTSSTCSQPRMTFSRYCQVLYLLARHGLRAEAVKDVTLINDGLCRGVHRYQIIARRQDFETPCPHGVAVFGLPTSSHRMSAFRPTSMGTFIR